MTFIPETRMARYQLTRILESVAQLSSELDKIDAQFAAHTDDAAESSHPADLHYGEPLAVVQDAAPTQATPEPVEPSPEVTESDPKVDETAQAEPVAQVVPEPEPQPEPQPEPEPETTQAPEPVPAPAVSFTDLRAKCADLSRAGHTETIRTLIQKHGAHKLSELPESAYTPLFEDIERIAA